MEAVAIRHRAKTFPELGASGAGVFARASS